jgi:hypothetical protein
MSDFQTRIGQLSKRVLDLGKVVADLTAKRVALAPAAVDGDNAARSQLEELEAAATNATREAALVNDAIAELKKLAAQQQQQAVDTERMKRDAKAANISETILGIDAEIDATLARLRQMFEERRVLAGELRRTNTCDPHLVTRLHQRYGANAACYHAGLREYIGLELVTPEQVRPLTKSDNWLTWPRKGTDSQELEKQGNSHGNNQTQERSDSHDH